MSKEGSGPGQSNTTEFNHTSDGFLKRRWQALKSDKTFRGKLTHTFCYLASFNAVGCIVGLLGPTFLDLQLISGTDVKEAARMFTSQSAGHMTGTLVSGFLYDRMNRNLVLTIAIFFCSMGTILIPWCSYFSVMIAVFAIRGVTMGLIDNGSNSGTVQIWGKDSGPYMQALHFSFAVGAMVSPLLATPFLASASSTDNYSTHVLNPLNLSLHSSLNKSSLGTEYSNEFEFDMNKTSKAQGPITETDPMSKIHYAYLIVGIWILVTSLPFLIRFCRNRQIRIHKTTKRTEAAANDINVRDKIFLFVLLGMFFLLYAGSFDCFSGFLMTFVVKQLLWTKSEGLLLTSSYWAAFAVSRGLAVIVARLLSPAKMIFGNYTIMIGAIIGIMFGSVQSSIAMWVCTIMVGLSMSSTFPAAFTWTERNLFNVTGKVSAFFILSASTGTIVLPLLLGYLFQEIAKSWYLYLTLGSGVVCTCVFALLVTLAKCRQQDPPEKEQVLELYDHDNAKLKKLLNSDR